MVVWAAVFMWAALSGLGSYSAALWPAFVAYVGTATIVGPTSREGAQ